MIEMPKRMNVGLSPYEKFDLEEIDGCPKCPECGLKMQIDRGKWSCMNEECSIISIDRKKGHLQTLRRVVRDSILYSEELKAKMEVES